MSELRRTHRLNGRVYPAASGNWLVRLLRRLWSLC